MLDARTEGQQLKDVMDAQGRSWAWLSRETGYSDSYIHKIVAGTRPWTEDFGIKVQQALGFMPTVVEHVHGRMVTVPRNVFERRAELTVEGIAFELEQAWKDAWLREHAVTTLADAAERAYQHAVAMHTPPAPVELEDDTDV